MIYFRFERVPFAKSFIANWMSAKYTQWSGGKVIDDYSPRSQVQFQALTRGLNWRTRTLVKLYFWLRNLEKEPVDQYREAFYERDQAILNTHIGVVYIPPVDEHAYLTDAEYLALFGTARYPSKIEAPEAVVGNALDPDRPS